MVEERCTHIVYDDGSQEVSMRIQYSGRRFYYNVLQNIFSFFSLLGGLFMVNMVICIRTDAGFC